MTDCVNRLIAKRPQNRKDATSIFEYFTTRLNEIGQNHVAKLADAAIIPIWKQNGQSEGTNIEGSVKDLIHITPRQCYLGNATIYGEIFDFADFGERANYFLQKCGSKHEPSKKELASLACKEPARLLGILQSPEKYLNMLASLAADFDTLKRDKVLMKQMQMSKFLLGYNEIPANKENGKVAKSNALDEYEDDEFDEPSIKQYSLTSASQVLIVSLIPSLG